MARRLAATELRREGLQEIKGPFEFAELPGAACAFGWPSEAWFGGRVAASQLALLSGWPGSAASLGTAVLLVVPLLVMRPVATIVHALASPPAAACRSLSSLADRAVLVLSALATSGAILLQSIAMGAPLSPAAAAAGGSQLMLAFGAQLKRRPVLGILYAVWANCGWAPLKEELLFRGLLQARLRALLERLPPRAARLLRGDARTTARPVSYTHLTLPTICSV
eukprot:559307-Prymnesium_polylepis.1